MSIKYNKYNKLLISRPQVEQTLQEKTITPTNNTKLQVDHHFLFQLDHRAQHHTIMEDMMTMR